MHKVCFITNIPSPYKVKLLNILSEHFDIEVLFEKRKEADRLDEWYSHNFNNLRVSFLDEKPLKKIRQASKTCDLLINCDYTNPLAIFAMFNFKIQKKPIVMLADGGLVVKRGLIDKVISLLMNANDYFMSSGGEVDKYFTYYGVDKSKIYRYRFSSLTQDDINENKKYRLQRDHLKQKLNIDPNIPALISVGQQVRRKGIDILVEAIALVDTPISLYIIGGKPEENIKNIIEKNKIKNIYFIDFLPGEKLKDYYGASDVFIMPTRYDIWGLVINEAMSFGLPIISSDMCVASLEFKNHFDNIVLFESENINDLNNKIKDLIKDHKKQEDLSRKSLEAIKDYHIENTALDFKTIINGVLRDYYG